MKSVKGFTLVETLITIAILGIVMSMAMPNLTRFVTSMRVDNEIAKLQRFLLATRNAAINSGETVTVCPLTSNSCSSSWGNKVTIFIDVDGDGNFDSSDNDEVLSVKDAINADDTLQFSRNRVTYSPSGLSFGYNGTFAFCPANQSELSRGITVAGSGRVYVSKDTDGDGKDESRLGAEFTCT